MVSHLWSFGVEMRTRMTLGLGGMALAIAIASPLVLSPAGQAQQTLPPPPSVPNSTELPSLAPIAAPPTPGVMVPPPAGLPPLPQESVYQAPQPNSTMMPAPPVTTPSAMPEMRASYYQVVVPTRTEDFGTIANKMISMGVRPEAIQAKQRPLGPHLAVGPFVNLGEAEGVSNYLRSGGMDARVFFQK